METTGNDSTKDSVMPTGKWEFDSDVAKCFKNMLERSIPDYQSMRSLVYKIGERFVKPGTWITDIGCSTGLAIEPFYNHFKDENGYHLIDNSKAMIDECRSKFGVVISDGKMKLDNRNFWEVDLEAPSSLVLSILTMQFTPTAYRQNEVKKVYDALVPGGAFIYVEKVVCDEGMDDLFLDLYYDMKRANGYSDEAIGAKRKSLENVLSPLKAEWNVDLLHEAGFRQVDMFWRCLNFCGWVAVK